jgi:DNA-binding CsgD family transcriptional regulator
MRCPACGHVLSVAVIEEGQPLSYQEERLIGCIFRGMRARSIARECGLSYSAVKQALSRAYRKLGVEGDVDLATKAYREGGAQLWLHNPADELARMQ